MFESFFYGMMLKWAMEMRNYMLHFIHIQMQGMGKEHQYSICSWHSFETTQQWVIQSLSAALWRLVFYKWTQEPLELECCTTIIWCTLSTKADSQAPPTKDPYCFATSPPPKRHKAKGNVTFIYFQNMPCNKIAYRLFSQNNMPSNTENVSSNLHISYSARSNAQ